MRISDWSSDVCSSDLLGIAAAIDLIGVTYEPLLMATGRMNWSVKIRLFNAVLLVVILTILLPRFGTIGAAIATLAVAVVGLLLMGRAAKRAALQADRKSTRLNSSH